MRIADLGALGYLPLQCADTRYALEVRPTIRATRIQSRWSDSLGRYVQEPSSSGDVLCSFLWRSNTAGGSMLPGGVPVATGVSGAGGGLPGRKIPGWAFAWPVVATGDSPGAPKGDDDQNAYGIQTVTAPTIGANAGGGFTGIPGFAANSGGGTQGSPYAQVVPVYDSRWTPDTRFATKELPLPPGMPPVAAGTVGLAMAGTREFVQEEIFFPIGGAANLIATHYGGDFWRSTHVYDLASGGALDQVMKAKLHQLLRVYEIPRHCGASTSAAPGILGKPGNHSLALQAGTARGGIPGNLLVADDRWLGGGPPGSQDFGVVTNRLNGALSVGTCSKHLYWPDDTANTKGDRFRPLHLDVAAYWDMKHFGCGPLEFQRLPYPKDARDNGVPTKVYLGYDADMPHSFACGERTGMWRWWTTTPIYKPPQIQRSVPGTEDGRNTQPGVYPDVAYTDPNDPSDEVFRTSPQQDQDTTNPPEGGIPSTAPPESQITDPNTEGFVSDPGTLADPGPNASHAIRDLGIPGFTDPDKDPWFGDGPTHTTPTAPYDGPVRIAPGSQGQQQLFGFNFLENVIDDGSTPVAFGVAMPVPGFDRTQTARARNGVALDYLAVPTEVAFSGLIGRAANVAPSAADYRNYFGWGSQDAAYVDGSSPSVFRLEPWAQTIGGIPKITAGPGRARYTYEANGGLAFYPPGIGGEQIFDGKSPSASSTASFVMYSGQNAQTYLGIGTPSYGLGGVSRGYRFGISADGTQLQIYQISPGGDPTQALTLDANTGTGTLFGSTIGTSSTPATLPQGYISGFNLTYNGGSPSAPTVSGSIARDSTNAVNISLAGPTGADYLSNGLNANDALLSSAGDVGTGGCQNGTYQFSGGPFYGACFLDSGGSWLAKFTQITLSGTHDVAARDATTKIQKITGHSSKYLSELAQGDLIGNSSTGWGMVCQIDSDTQCWIFKEFSDNSANTYSGQTFTAYAYPSVQIGTIPACKICEVSKSGVTAWSPTAFNAGTLGTSTGNIASGGAVKIGQPPARTTFSTPSLTCPSFVYLYARATSGGTSTLCWSTNRQAPQTPASFSGYTYYRRVAVLPIWTDNFCVPFTQTNLGAARLYLLEGDLATYGGLAVLNGSSGSASWARQSLAAGVPPTSTTAIVNAEINSPSGLGILYLRAGNVGTSTVSRPRILRAATSTANSAEFTIGTDGAQCVDYGTSTGVGSPYNLYVLGYYDLP